MSDSKTWKINKASCFFANSQQNLFLQVKEQSIKYFNLRNMSWKFNHSLSSQQPPFDMRPENLRFWKMAAFFFTFGGLNVIYIHVGLLMAHEIIYIDAFTKNILVEKTIKKIHIRRNFYWNRLILKIRIWFLSILFNEWANHFLLFGKYWC